MINTFSANSNIDWVGLSSKRTFGSSLGNFCYLLMHVLSSKSNSSYLVNNSQHVLLPFPTISVDFINHLLHFCCCLAQLEMEQWKAYILFSTIFFLQYRIKRALNSEHSKPVFSSVFSLLFSKKRWSSDWLIFMAYQPV